MLTRCAPKGSVDRGPLILNSLTPGPSIIMATGVLCCAQSQAHSEAPSAIYDVRFATGWERPRNSLPAWQPCLTFSDTNRRPSRQTCEQSKQNISLISAPVIARGRVDIHHHHIRSSLRSLPPCYLNTALPHLSEGEIASLIHPGRGDKFPSPRSQSGRG
jgi:hypothetical protein